MMYAPRKAEGATCGAFFLFGAGKVYRAQFPLYLWGGISIAKRTAGSPCRLEGGSCAALSE